MALLKCPDCENHVSDLAISCPHCGRPIKDAMPLPVLSPEEEVRAANEQFVNTATHVPAEDLFVSGESSENIDGPVVYDYDAQKIHSAFKHQRNSFLWKMSAIVIIFGALFGLFYYWIRDWASFIPVLLILAIIRCATPLFKFGRECEYEVTYYTGGVFGGSSYTMTENAGWLGALIGFALSFSVLYGGFMLSVKLWGDSNYATAMYLTVCFVIVFFPIFRYWGRFLACTWLASATKDLPDLLTFHERLNKVNARRRKMRVINTVLVVVFVVSFVALGIIGYQANQNARNDALNNLIFDREEICESFDEGSVIYSAEDIHNMEFEFANLSDAANACTGTGTYRNTRNGVTYDMCVNIDLAYNHLDDQWHVKTATCKYDYVDMDLKGVWFGNASAVMATSTADDKITLTITESSNTEVLGHLRYVNRDGDVVEVDVTGVYQKETALFGEYEGERLYIIFTPSEEFWVFFEQYLQLIMKVDFINGELYWETPQAALTRQAA